MHYREEEAFSFSRYCTSIFDNQGLLQESITSCMCLNRKSRFLLWFVMNNLLTELESGKKEMIKHLATSALPIFPMQCCLERARTSKVELELF